MSKIKIGDFKLNMYKYNDEQFNETTITNIFFNEFGVEYKLQGQNEPKYITYEDYYIISSNVVSIK